jgi:hypothetical protein
MSKIQTLMQQVAEIATARKDLEVQERAMKEALLEEMKKKGTEKEKNEYGSFTIKPYTKWHYSAAVVTLEEDLKIRKADEVEQGIASAEVTESLTFLPAKVK